MSILKLENLWKSFGLTRAVVDVSLDIEPGEFMGLLGPSGCGKTTTLRLIVGLEKPESGSIVFDGQDITALPPERRGFGMVFQNYALFPHLNVFDNVAFGLRARRLSKEEIRFRVFVTLGLLELNGLERRRLNEISGGQQQRVAIARAIVIEPKLLLLDEPLSNLDLGLRESTRREIRELVKRLKITTIYVTHDQEEAFDLCDRIAVMIGGELLQVGTPSSLYDRPDFVAVARFLGRNNFIAATRANKKTDKVLRFRSIAGGHDLRVLKTNGKPGPFDQPMTLAIRPEHISVSRHSIKDENSIRAIVQSVSFNGPVGMITLDSGGLILDALAVRDEGIAPGDKVIMTLPSEKIRMLSK